MKSYMAYVPVSDEVQAIVVVPTSDAARKTGHATAKQLVGSITVEADFGGPGQDPEETEDPQLAGTEAIHIVRHIAFAHGTPLSPHLPSRRESLTQRSARTRIPFTDSTEIASRSIVKVGAVASGELGANGQAEDDGRKGTKTSATTANDKLNVVPSEGVPTVVVESFAGQAVWSAEHLQQQRQQQVSFTAEAYEASPAGPAATASAPDGDLRREESQSELLGNIRKKVIFQAHFAPPCGSMSTRRNLDGNSTRTQEQP